MSNIPKEVQEQYQKLKGEYSEILKRYIQLQEERRENNLVLNNLIPLEGERRTWKVVGGILVQYTLEETMNSLKQNVVMLEQALKALDVEMGKREKQVLQIELKYNLNPSKKGPQEMENVANKQSGLLA